MGCRGQAWSQGGQEQAATSDRRETTRAWTRVLGQAMEFRSSPSPKALLVLGILLLPPGVASSPHGLRCEELGKRCVFSSQTARVTC